MRFGKENVMSEAHSFFLTLLNPAKRDICEANVFNRVADLLIRFAHN